MCPTTLSDTTVITKPQQYPINAAVLLLEDGSQYMGHSIGATGTTFGELVFNTALTGYQEILTDPSYTGQIVLMTYPEIGNYGVNTLDIESNTGLHAAGFVVRELSQISSSWRAEDDIESYLKAHHIVGIAGIDTRALTRKIRVLGSPKTAITTDFENIEKIKLALQALPDFAEQDFVYKVSTKTSSTLSGEPCSALKNIIVLDFGIKQSFWTNSSYTPKK